MPDTSAPASAPTAPPSLTGRRLLPAGRVSFLLALMAVSAGLGVLYGWLFGEGHLVGAPIYGLFIGTAVVLFERQWIFPGLQRRLRLLPTPFYVLGTEAALFAMIVAGTLVGGTCAWALGLAGPSLAKAAMPTTISLVYSFVVCAAMVSVLRVRDLLGAETFLNLLIGRYHKPVREERIFLFLDVAGSTAYAEAHGDVAAQAWLGAIFAALAEPVRRHRGQIDDYVGDLAMITWPLGRGVRNANCVACLFEILERIEATAADWQRRFGQVPRFRAALHAGTVVTAEVGVDRHKIAYFGDVVNTTARLEGLSRTLGAPFLISGELLRRLDRLPPGIAARPLGEHALRGRDARLAVAALERATAPGAAALDRAEIAV